MDPIKEKTDIFNTISIAYHMHHSLTKCYPTRIYMGREELYDLRRSAYVDIPSSIIMGMQIFEVNAQSHFYVC